MTGVELNKPGTGADLDMVLAHDGQRWIARATGWLVRGRDWAELDRRLLQHLRESGRWQGCVRVCMRFDMDSLPRWLHQYSGHYFNRELRLDLPETTPPADPNSETAAGGAA